MSSTLQIKKRVSGAPGAPVSLKTAELAINMVDNILYVGFGDDGGGNATSVVAFAATGFVANLPAGGNALDVLRKNAANDGYELAAPAAGGSTYTAGAGLNLAADEFSIDFASVAALASPAFSGTPTAPTPLTADASTKVATTAFVDARINQILAGAGAAYDTLSEIQVLMEADDTEIAGLITTVAGKLQKDQNLSDLTDAAAARGNLGIGSMGTQSASAVAITGGTIDGVALDGGTF